MNKISIAAGAALLLIPQLLPPTAANAASGKGTVHVTATFTKSSDFSLPVRCSVSINPNGGPGRAVASEQAMSQGQELSFSGNSASCDITMNYGFDNIDPDQGITVSVDIESDAKAQFTGASVNTNFIGMSRTWSTSIGNPANGATTDVPFGNLTL